MNWYTWARRAPTAKEWSSDSPVSCKYLHSGLRAEGGQERCGLCLTPWWGHLHLCWPWGCCCCSPHPGNLWASFEGSQAAKRSGCWAPVRGSATRDHYPSFWSLTFIQQRPHKKKGRVEKCNNPMIHRLVPHIDPPTRCSQTSPAINALLLASSFHQLCLLTKFSLQRVVAGFVEAITAPNMALLLCQRRLSHGGLLGAVEK